MGLLVVVNEVMAQKKGFTATGEKKAAVRKGKPAVDYSAIAEAVKTAHGVTEEFETKDNGAIVHAMGWTVDGAQYIFVTYFTKSGSTSGYTFFKDGVLQVADKGIAKALGFVGLVTGPTAQELQAVRLNTMGPVVGPLKAESKLARAEMTAEDETGSVEE